MPIRINLLAEQQLAEEMRRKDPVKRALWIGGALVFATLVWTFMLHAQVKARRSELGNLTAEFQKIDESAKVVRNMQAEAGQYERRMAALEKYSTNRVLWGSMLDGLQQATMDQIRLKSIGVKQNYTTNSATNFFSTNVLVAFESKPFWKFWGSKGAAVPPTVTATNMLRGINSMPPFSTNKLPYTMKVDLTATNPVSKQYIVKAEFTLPATSIEEIELNFTAGDYGNPPGNAIDPFLRKLVSVPYFAERMPKGEATPWYMERPANPQTDMSDPNQPTYLPFNARIRYEPRVLINE